MRLVLNGEDKDVAADTVDALVAELGLANTRVAVELNRVIVRRASWAETALKEGDVVEVVHFVGGG
jgi:thiamine biosynthesis protein ThiS